MRLVYNTVKWEVFVWGGGGGQSKVITFFTGLEHLCIYIECKYRSITNSIVCTSQLVLARHMFRSNEVGNLCHNKAAKENSELIRYQRKMVHRIRQ